MMERGHFMLVGVGGSGKTSITTLSSALAGNVMEQIVPKKNYDKKEFKEDLLRMMKKASKKDNHVTFFFPDTQILNEGFLEDVNNLLNSGEVPNMLTKEDFDDIAKDLESDARKLKVDTNSLFIHRVRS